MAVKDKARFFRVVLGNIVICVTAVALVIMTTYSGGAKTEVRSEPYYSGKASDKVSLMINVYWGTEYIQPMLDILERYHARTTFFVGGSWVAGNCKTLESIYAAGHEIGNHGYYHKDHKKLDAAYNKKEIASAHEAVMDAIGVNMELFAPPSGSFCDETLAVAESLGYKTIMWTRDTIDWRDGDPDIIYRRAVKNLRGGDLILMHPTDGTVKALERIIATIYSADLSIAPVSEVLRGSVSA